MRLQLLVAVVLLALSAGAQSYEQTIHGPVVLQSTHAPIVVGTFFVDADADSGRGIKEEMNPPQIISTVEVGGRFKVLDATRDYYVTVNVELPNGRSAGEFSAGAYIESGKEEAELRLLLVPSSRAVLARGNYIVSLMVSEISPTSHGDLAGSIVDAIQMDQLRVEVSAEDPRCDPTEEPKVETMEDGDGLVHAVIRLPTSCFHPDYAVTYREEDGALVVGAFGSTGVLEDVGKFESIKIVSELEDTIELRDFPRELGTSFIIEATSEESTVFVGRRVVVSHSNVVIRAGEVAVRGRIEVAQDLELSAFRKLMIHGELEAIGGNVMMNANKEGYESRISPFNAVNLFEHASVMAEGDVEVFGRSGFSPTQIDSVGVDIECSVILARAGKVVITGHAQGVMSAFGVRTRAPDGLIVDGGGELRVQGYASRIPWSELSDLFENIDRISPMGNDVTSIDISSMRMLDGINNMKMIRGVLEVELADGSTIMMDGDSMRMMMDLERPMLPAIPRVPLSEALFFGILLGSNDHETWNAGSTLSMQGYSDTVGFASQLREATLRVHCESLVLEGISRAGIAVYMSTLGGSEYYVASKEVAIFAESEQSVGVKTQVRGVEGAAAEDEFILNVVGESVSVEGKGFERGVELGSERAERWESTLGKVVFEGHSGFDAAISSMLAEDALLEVIGAGGIALHGERNSNNYPAYFPAYYYEYYSYTPDNPTPIYFPDNPPPIYFPDNPPPIYFPDNPPPIYMPGDRIPFPYMPDTARSELGTTPLGRRDVTSAWEQSGVALMSPGTEIWFAADGDIDIYGYSDAEDAAGVFVRSAGGAQSFGVQAQYDIIVVGESESYVGSYMANGVFDAVDGGVLFSGIGAEYGLKVGSTVGVTVTAAGNGVIVLDGEATEGDGVFIVESESVVELATSGGDIELSGTGGSFGVHIRGAMSMTVDGAGSAILGQTDHVNPDRGDISLDGLSAVLDVNVLGSVFLKSPLKGENSRINVANGEVVVQSISNTFNGDIVLASGTSVTGGEGAHLGGLIRANPGATVTAGVVEGREFDCMSYSGTVDLSDGGTVLLQVEHINLEAVHQLGTEDVECGFADVIWVGRDLVLGHDAELVIVLGEEWHVDPADQRFPEGLEVGDRIALIYVVSGDIIGEFGFISLSVESEQNYLTVVEDHDAFWLEVVDGCPEDDAKIFPGPCGCGIEELYQEGSPFVLCTDECPDDPLKVTPGICGCGVSDTADSDRDGVIDCLDGCPEDRNKATPGVCGCGEEEDTTDSDGDGVADCVDECREDPNKAAAGQCGCFVLDVDSDGDGVADCIDLCPLDVHKDDPGICGCGVVDFVAGSDNPTCSDGCPDDPHKDEPGVCGCGVSDKDSDGDGVPDCIDECKDDREKQRRGDCGCGVEDSDANGDGIVDCWSDASDHLDIEHHLELPNSPCFALGLDSIAVKIELKLGPFDLCRQQWSLAFMDEMANGMRRVRLVANLPNGAVAAFDYVSVPEALDDRVVYEYLDEPFYLYQNSLKSTIELKNWPFTNEDSVELEMGLIMDLHDIGREVELKKLSDLRQALVFFSEEEKDMFMRVGLFTHLQCDGKMLDAGLSYERRDRALEMVGSEAARDEVEYVHQVRINFPRFTEGCDWDPDFSVLLDGGDSGGNYSDPIVWLSLGFVLLALVVIALAAIAYDLRVRFVKRRNDLRLDSQMRDFSTTAGSEGSVPSATVV